ncbi:MAG: alkaline phosphatase [Halioglobus sp.]|jgi:alkaline phosphatase
MKQYFHCLLASLLLPSSGLFAQDSTTFAAEDTQATRNVILIIGDGMDEQQITIARNYLKGAKGRLLLDDMPLRGAVQVLSVADNNKSEAIYVADSANTATSMATGEVTSRGRISTSAGRDVDLTTIVELATASGLRSGLVTTASVTDATPAAFASHINFRLCENPDSMIDVTMNDIYLGDCSEDLKANGGKGSISEQLANSSLHVILGGGRKHFSPMTPGGEESVAALAQRNGFQLLETNVELISAEPDNRLLGLFSTSTMPVRLQGEDGRAAQEPETSLLHSVHRYLGDVTMPAAMTCEPNPAHAAVPSLKQMTDTALTQLSHKNDAGFFLMVESASIDKQAHERKPCGSIGEVAQLEEALASALAFAEQHPRTLILVTADHSQAAQIIPVTSLFAAYPIPLYTPGKLAQVITAEGSVMAINYATTNFFVEEHTGAAVPLFANSEAVGRVPAFIQQPQIFDIVRDYLGLQ